jgi:hypothetical protein
MPSLDGSRLTCFQLSWQTRESSPDTHHADKDDDGESHPHREQEEWHDIFLNMAERLQVALLRDPGWIHSQDRISEQEAAGHDDAETGEAEARPAQPRAPAAGDQLGGIESQGCGPESVQPWDMSLELGCQERHEGAQVTRSTIDPDTLWIEIEEHDQQDEDHYINGRAEWVDPIQALALARPGTVHLVDADCRCLIHF